MKKQVILTIVAILAFITIAVSQATPHSVTLSWSDTLNPAGTTYSVYRSNGLCSGTPTFSKLATALTAKTYMDATVTPGNYCYQVSASFNGMESTPSNSVNPSVPAFSPSALSYTVQ